MNAQGLNIEPASNDDFEFYYLLKCEPESIYWSGFKSAPDKDKLFTWFIERVKYFNDKDGYKLYMIVKLINEIMLKVGYVSIYPVEGCERCCEIAIGVSQVYAGNGIGSQALKMAVNTFIEIGYSQVVAFIRKDNEKSRLAFTKAGFIKTNHTKTIFIENLNDTVEMNQYIYKGNINE